MREDQIEKMEVIREKQEICQQREQANKEISTCMCKINKLEELLKRSQRSRSDLYQSLQVTTVPLRASLRRTLHYRLGPLHVHVQLI